MRFSVSALVMCLLPVVYSAALPQTTTVCYDECVAATSCLAIWPDGCYCANDVKTKCAAACPEEEIVPVLDICTEPVVLTPGSCYQDCVSGWACIQSWPASCYCHNGIVGRCSTECGTTPVYQDCGDGAV